MADKSPSRSKNSFLDESPADPPRKLSQRVAHVDDRSPLLVVFRFTSTTLVAFTLPPEDRRSASAS